MTKQVVLKVEKESLKKLTVFNDRAELKRVFEVELDAGQNEVVIENVSRSIQDDSVRVTGRGDATIEEVQVTDRRTTAGAGDSSRAKILRANKEDIEKELIKVDGEKTSLTRRIDALDAMIGQIGNGIVSPKDSKFTADADTLGSITTFFDFYNTQTIELRSSLAGKDKERNEVQQRLNVAEHELNQIEHGDFIRVVSVILDSKAGGKVLLELTYQVWGANWNPFYDVRVDTSKDGKNTMQLSYYGNVTQSTGEDWEGAELVLSTARPCVGGTIPDLGTLDVSFFRPPPPAPPVQPMMMRTFGAAPPMGKMARNEVCEMMAYDAAPMLGGAMANVSAQTLSTEFIITRPCSIPSDGASHKVTIGIVDLEPQLVHETVPSKTASAFLTASCINTSALPLLEGEASVYLDGAFVAKTSLKCVSPGERFRSSLGVDPAVKIEYKPVHKYHEQVGLINKSSSTVHEQKIIVKNTRADAVLLKLRDHIPRPTDEKIKVKVISPESIEKLPEEAGQGESDAAPSPGARLTPANNLEWTVKLEKGAGATFVIKYQIEHPASEKLEFAERFN